MTPSFRLEKNLRSRPEWTDRVAALECGYSAKQIAILSFGSPVPALPGKVVVENVSLGKNTPAGRSRSLPYHRHYSPPPTKLPLNALYRHLSSRFATSTVTNGAGPDGCLPELDMFPPVASCVYGICAFVLRCFFSVLTLYSQWSIVWGLIFFFSSLSSCKCCTFLPFPVFLFCLPRCHMYVVYVWTG